MKQMKPMPEGLRIRYEEALHGMQTGVKVMVARQGPAYEHAKHLRVGVNSAMSAHKALVDILLDKGVISEDEYYETIVRAMEEERRSYERQLGVKLG